ncbi:MAG TPA: VOC family protein [Anaerolineaceae bacterium]|nr:VOC family protein [Anaerolineaceae bacterium]
MKTLNPYFTFAGNCRAAMEFYRDCLNGEITQMQTFEDAKYEVEENRKKNIIHAELRAEGILLMASDGMPGFEAQPGNTVSLTIDLTDVNEEERIFAALAVGGKVTMPLQTTFWGARYGMLTDRYGIQWMLNCSKP